MTLTELLGARDDAYENYTETVDGSPYSEAWQAAELAFAKADNALRAALAEADIQSSIYAAEKRMAASDLERQRAAALVALVATWREWAASEAHELADDSITLESSEWVPGPAADLPEHMACAEAMAAALDLCPPPAREGGDE